MVSPNKPENVLPADLIKEFIESLDISGKRVERIYSLFDPAGYSTEKNLEEFLILNRELLSGLNSRRSEMEIIATLLILTRKECKKTDLIYGANLSGKQLKNYLSYLLGNDFLKEKNHKNQILYRSTAKANVFLYHWIKIIELFTES